MADWDAKSPELLRNLDEVGRKVNAAARDREPLSSQAIREWQTLIMLGLTPTDGEPFGVFRGEAGLEDYVVEIGDHLGALPEDVARELAQFDRKLTERLNDLDDTIRCEPFDEPTEDDLESVIILCAWAHGEWVRIHPFPNGNGRTARILVNSIAQRYGLPAFMGIRPRPGSEYTSGLLGKPWLATGKQQDPCSGDCTKRHSDANLNLPIEIKGPWSNSFPPKTI